jgi:hypothetical protein
MRPSIGASPVVRSGSVIPCTWALATKDRHPTAKPKVDDSILGRSDGLMLIGKTTFDGTHAPTNTFNCGNRDSLGFRITIRIVLHRLVLAARTVNSFPNTVFNFIVNS